MYKKCCCCYSFLFFDLWNQLFFRIITRSHYRFWSSLLQQSILTCYLLLQPLLLLESYQNFIIDEIINEFDYTHVVIYTDWLYTWLLLILFDVHWYWIRWVQSIFDWNELKMFHKRAFILDDARRKICVTKQIFFCSCFLIELYRMEWISLQLLYFSVEWFFTSIFG